MRTYLTRAIVLAGLLVVMTGAYAPAGEQDSLQVVARVGHLVVTVGDIQKIVNDRSIYEENPVSDHARIKAVLDEEITDRLIRLESKDVSLREEYAFSGRLRHALTTLASRLYSTERIAPLLHLDSARVDSFYHAHEARYTTPHDQIRVRQITVYFPGKGIPKNATTFVDPVYDGWDPKRKIDSIYTRLADGEGFAVLATIHSEDIHTRGTGGDMGWVSSHSLPPGIFADRCLRQPLHYISRPFGSEIGWHIVQVTASRPAGLVPLDATIREDVLTQLADAQAAELSTRLNDSLRFAGAIEYAEKALAAPDDQLRPGTVLAVCNGRDTIYAGEYLQDQYRWVQANKGRPLGAEEKRNVISTQYFKYACWYDAMRKLGYLDRPEVRELRDKMVQEEQMNAIRLRMSDPGWVPDSAAVAKYYADHRELFRNPPRTLSEAKTFILNKLQTEHQDQVRRQWIERMTARHGVVRDEDKLSAVRLIPHNG